MRELIVATKNIGKVKEFTAILQTKGFNVKSLFDYPNAPEVEEIGETFAENALLKAKEIVHFLKKPVIADDSGLVIDALNGRPGVYSARYAGAEKDDRKNIEKVLQEMKGVPEDKRTARFHCAIAVVFPDGMEQIVEGTCEGKITNEPKGENGFGYDPIMYIPTYKKTMAELTSEEKNKISHRANALKKVEQLLSSNEIL